MDFKFYGDHSKFVRNNGTCQYLRKCAYFLSVRSFNAPKLFKLILSVEVKKKRENQDNDLRSK